MSAVVLAVVVTGITQMLQAGLQQSDEAIQIARASALAEAMVEEVLSRPLTDPDGHVAVGPDAGERSRRDFDAADDFDGLTQAVGEVTDAAGESYGGSYARFGRSVKAQWIDLDTLLGENRGLQVTVTVTDTRGRQWSIRRFVPESSDE